MGTVRKAGVATVVAAVVVCAAFAAGCSKKDFNKEVVAKVNGEEITVLELREYLGAPVGVFTFEKMPVEEKRQAVERLVAGSLLVQEGISMGLPDTAKYKEAVEKNQSGVKINALLRKEAGEKLKVDDKEVKAESEKIRKENPGIPETEASGRAAKAIVERQLRKIQQDLVATARKETGAAIDNAALERIGKGESLPDNAVLASAGDEKILYSDVKKVIREMPSLPVLQGGQNDQMTRALVARIVEQELILRAMTAYSKMRNVEGTEFHKASRRNMERSLIANMMFDNVTETVTPATDSEVAADYQRRVQSMQGGKEKAPPIDAVREQLREILTNRKRREMFETHIEELRKKGKVTVNDEVLSKV
ncbi:MAG: hypothetical protein AB1346_12820 [Thermodesulfobacteriota bacterium]